MKTTKTRSIGASPTVKSTARRPSTQTPRSSVRVSLKRSKRSEPTEPSGRTLAPAHIQLPREGVRVETESVPHEVRSALTLYMQDAVEVPLLSIEEEIELAARIKKGDMAAREHMIRANLRLVVKIARDYDGLEELAEEMEVPVRKIKLWQRASMKTASLDQPLGDDESSRLGEVVPDEAMSDPYRKLEEETTHAMVRGFLDILDPRELTILKERFGLDGGPEKTLDDIGRQFGVTRERIRQLQNLALAKLRRQIEKLEAVRQPGENPLLDQFSRMATAAA
jgi:DNA-directed RNA polymerase sigma subunit (sigma70/sigma32)